MQSPNDALYCGAASPTSGSPAPGSSGNFEPGLRHHTEDSHSLPMCGIAGYINLDPARPAEPGLVRSMTDALVHRGPDDEGFHVREEVALGMRRLAIIDLQTG